MGLEAIKARCLERGFTIEKINTSRKSITCHLTRDADRFLLKKLLVVATEDIDQKFQTEITSMHEARELSNDDVSIPEIVDIDVEHHFYISRRINGQSMHELLSSHFPDRNRIYLIHQQLFAWLGDYYRHFELCGNNEVYESVKKDGPYTKKASLILNDREDFSSYLNGLGIPISKVHGDLTPWNILLNPDNRLYIIDWGNSGIDYPAHDVSRYMLHVLRKLHFKGMKHRYNQLFIKSFLDLFGDDPRIWKKVVQFQYSYSRRITLKKTSSAFVNCMPVRLTRLFLLRLAYRDMRKINA